MPALVQQVGSRKMAKKLTDRMSDGIENREGNQGNVIVRLGRMFLITIREGRKKERRKGREGAWEGDRNTERV